MKKRNTDEAYEKNFRKKIRAARIASGIGPDEMAKRLSVSRDSYNRYESQGERAYMMPHHLLVPFCKITGADLSTLLAPPPKRGPKLHSVR